MDAIRDALKDVPYIGPYIEVKPKIAVLRMAGVIADSAMIRRAGISHHKFSKAIDKAFGMSNLRAVALVINSPGGAPAQCSLITAHMRRLAEEKKVPVYAFVEDVAASGGYWLACAGDKIYAQSASIVGSIGVISAGFGLEEFIKKHDIKRRVYTSGRDKSFLDPFKPEKAEDLARLRDLQEKIHESFRDWVRARRGDRLNGGEDEVMEGAFWTAEDALSLGLIDGVGDLKGTMRDMFGEDVKFIECAPEKKLLAALLPLGGGADAQGPEWVQAALEAVESRAFWSRYGL